MNEKEAKAEFEKYLKNVNASLEEEKAERGKQRKPFSTKMRYKLELFLTLEQIKKIIEVLPDDVPND